MKNKYETTAKHAIEKSIRTGKPVRVTRPVFKALLNQRWLRPGHVWFARTKHGKPLVYVARQGGDLAKNWKARRRRIPDALLPYYGVLQLFAPYSGDDEWHAKVWNMTR